MITAAIKRVNLFFYKSIAIIHIILCLIFPPLIYILFSNQSQNHSINENLTTIKKLELNLE